MQDLNQPENLNENVLPGAADELTPQPEQTTEADPAEVLRTAMASNFLQHCLNSAVADQSHGGDPMMVGVQHAVGGLMLAILRMSPDQFQAVVESISRGLTEVRIDQTQLSELLMTSWAVGLARNGQLNRVLGQMKDVAEYDRNTFMIERMASLSNQTAQQPAEVAPEVAVPVEAQNAAEKPAEEAPKAEKRTAKKRKSDSAGQPA